MIKSSRKTAWTPERRAKQAAAVKIWAPWAHSTGPKTKAGKAKSSQNARKHYDEPMRKALRAQARYLAEAKAHFKRARKIPPNELLKNRRRTLLRRGRKVTHQLRVALVYAILCKNLAFPDPFPLKVNEFLPSPSPPPLRVVSSRWN